MGGGAGRAFEDRGLPAAARPRLESREIAGSKYGIDRRVGFNVKYRMPADTAAIYIHISITLICAIVCGDREKGPRVWHFHELWAPRAIFITCRHIVRRTITGMLFQYDISAR